jgi:hypothetical protein
MRKQINVVLTIVSLFSSVAVVSAWAQTSDNKMSQEKMSGTKMTHQQKMDKMSADDKAAMFDRMTEKDRMASMKMSGHDMAKMSSSERMDSKRTANPIPADQAA